MCRLQSLQISRSRSNLVSLFLVRFNCKSNIGAIKTSTMWLAGPVSQREEQTCFTEWEALFRRSRYRWEDDTKNITIRVIDRVHLDRNRAYWRALVNTVMNLQISDKQLNKDPDIMNVVISSLFAKWNHVETFMVHPYSLLVCSTYVSLLYTWDFHDYLNSLVTW